MFSFLGLDSLALLLEVKKYRCPDSLKQTSKVTADTPNEPKMPDPRKGDDIGKVKASVEGGKLRQLLNELHSDEDQ